MLPLGEVCEILDSRRKPITKRDRIPGPYPYYGATGVLDHVESYIFDEPLVLIGEDGAKWDAGEDTAYAVDGKCWVNNHAHVVRPNRDAVLDSWVIYYLNAIDLAPFISGLTVPKLNQGRLREIPIPLPPLSEQKRIVAILDEAFAGIATAVANTEKNLVNARELFESYLNSVFSQRGDGWVKRRLIEVCILQRGFDLPKRQRTLGSFELVSSSGVIDHHNEARVKGPGVVTGRSGSIGKVFFIEKDYWPLNTVLYVKEFFHNDPEFVYYLLSHFDLKKYTSGTGVPTLNRNHVHNEFVNIPESTIKQREIVEEINNLALETQRFESIYQQKLTALAELKQSLLQKAFAGELTTGVQDEVEAALA